MTEHAAVKPSDPPAALRTMVLREMTPGDPRSAALSLLDARAMGTEPHLSSIRTLRDWTRAAWGRDPVAAGAACAAAILDSFGAGLVDAYRPRTAPMAGTPASFARLTILPTPAAAFDRARARFMGALGAARLHLRIEAASSKRLHELEGPVDDWPRS